MDSQSGAAVSFVTIARGVDAEIEVKRSRFLARLRRVGEESEAREVIEAARKKHWQARHHCCAMVLGPAGATQRSSDDGEPAGTAGAPMLEVLRGHGVSDVVAVVSRYFGGTLLGAGGLVRAYSDAVRAALGATPLVRRQQMQLVTLGASAAEAGRIEHELRSRGVVVRDVAYGVRVQLTLAVPVGELEGLRSRVAELTAGDAQLHRTTTDWVDLSP